MNFKQLIILKLYMWLMIIGEVVLVTGVYAGIALTITLNVKDGFVFPSHTDIVVNTLMIIFILYRCVQLMLSINNMYTRLTK